jgi:Copper type II ascorbate-dependent monooxygenase, C-terminal domain
MCGQAFSLQPGFLPARGFSAARLLLLLLLLANLPISAAPVFSKDILPIIQDRCQQCHRPGEIAPMSFLTYSDTRPWAKAIRESAITRKMPPWFADPNYGHFANDRSLSKQEIETLVNWADGGAPEGDPKDAPPPRVWPQGWNISTPDAVFEMPAPFPIPKEGAIEYQYIILPTHFTEDKWVDRVEVRPSDRAAVHHAVVYIREPGSDWLHGRPSGEAFGLPIAKSLTTSDILMVYTPGNSFDSWPRGVAKKIRAGSDLILQMHYTTHGKQDTDRTRIGVVFAKQRPTQAILTLQMGNDKFVIPPGDSDYRVTVSGTLPNDAMLISLLPHMHLRGHRFEYQIVEPNGRIETLLRVTNYDFNWQLNYRLKEPRLIRAGTRLRWSAEFDNSKNNPRNPDATAEVRFGEQSWEEMMIGFFDVAVDAAMDKPTFFKRPGRAPATGPNRASAPRANFASDAAPPPRSTKAALAAAPVAPVGERDLK